MYLSNRIGVFAFLLVLILASTESVYARKKRVEPNRDKTTYLLLEAQRLEQMQNPDSLVVAFEILKKASEEDPQNQEARFKLASYYRALYMPEKYYNVVMEAAQLDTTNYYYSLEAAENAIKVRDYKQALEIYQRLIRNNPNDEKLYLEMSEAYILMGDIENAMACYDKIENLTENVEYVALSKAGIYEHFRMYDKSIVELKRISDAYPQNVEYLQYLALAYISADSLQKSREIIENINQLQEGCTSLLIEIEYYKRKQDSNNLKKTMQKALLCPEIMFEAKQELIKEYVSYFLHENNPEEMQEADEVFKSLTEQYPREVSFKELYANILMLLDKYPEAVEQCQSALYIDPENIGIEKQKVQILYYSGDYEAMNSAIAQLMAKADSSFVLEASAYYFASGQTNKAIDNLKSSAKKYTSSPLFVSEIYAYIADIYFGLKDWNATGEYYELSYKNNPNNLMMLNNYAYYLAETGVDLQRAEQMSAKAVKAKPNDPVYLDTYGWIYFKQGKYLYAELYLKRAIDNGADLNPEVLEHYGDVLFHQGKADEALKYWQRAYNKSPNKEEKKTLKQKIENKTYIENR